MATSRFFVADLPAKTNAADLNQIFQDYGEVAKVELKTKENLVDPENVKIIAFVTLKIDESDAQYCINELNWQKLHGAKLKVSLAKESFLDRLKREREEAEVAAVDTTKPSAEADTDLLSKNASNTRKTFSEDFELNDDDIAPELLITKKRAASSLHNGKIVIQAFDTTPLHVIDNSKKSAKKLDAKSTASDQKRKESLKKMKNQYKQNKSTIQQALAGLDVSSVKKIKFSDAEDDVEEENQSTNTGKKTKIFDTDDENEDDDTDLNLNLKPEYFGKKGEKLLKLQSAQSLDPRFKMSAKFVDDENDNDEQPNDVTSNTTEEQQKDDATNERNWQMGILEQVVGHKIDTAHHSGSSNTMKNKKMLRFDPSKSEHQKFLRTKDIDKSDSQLNRKLKSKNLATKDVDDETAEVSKEVFYTVSDSLTQSLKTRGDGFSLLNMFGSAGAQSEEQREDNLRKVTNEKILVNKLDKNALNPFSYDSSTDEEDNDVPKEETVEQQQEKQNKQIKQGKQNAKVKIVMETFFIPKNDPRLKEGAKFFKYNKEQETPEEYEEVRNRLKMLIKTKINKSKKQLIGGKRKERNKV